MDMRRGVALPSLCAEGSPSAVTILRRQGRADLHPAGLWGHGYIESPHNRLRKECFNRNHWNSLFETRRHRRLGNSGQI
jgi:hypothetical protein